MIWEPFKGWKGLKTNNFCSMCSKNSKRKESTCWHKEGIMSKREGASGLVMILWHWKLSWYSLSCCHASQLFSDWLYLTLMWDKGRTILSSICKKTFRYWILIARSCSKNLGTELPLAPIDITGQWFESGYNNILLMLMSSSSKFWVKRALRYTFRIV